MDGVVDAEVAVHDRGRRLRRHRIRQGAVQGRDIGEFAGLDPLPLGRPEIHLTGEESRWPTELLQADRVGAHRVQLGQYPHQFFDCGGHLRVAERSEVVPIADHGPVDVFDDRHRRTESDALRVKRDRFRHGYRGLLERVGHRVFARHIVCRRGEPGHRGSAHDPLGRFVGCGEGQIRSPAADEFHA
ncbi:hypothetical protein ABIA39_007807 [Nocardia sp. GAS34]